MLNIKGVYKKMKKRIFKVLGTCGVMLLVSLLSGCGDSEEAKSKLIIGKWKTESIHTNNMYITIYEGGNCAINSWDYDGLGTWSISGKTLSILGTSSLIWTPDSLIGNFSVDDTTLTFTNVNVDAKRTIDEIVYERVE